MEKQRSIRRTGWASAVAICGILSLSSCATGASTPEEAVVKTGDPASITASSPCGDLIAVDPEDRFGVISAIEEELGVSIDAPDSLVSFCEGHPETRIDEAVRAQLRLE